MTSYTPAAGQARPAITARPVESVDRLAAVPALGGARAAVVTVSSSIAIGTAVAGTVAIGARAAVEPGGALAAFAPGLAVPAGPAGAAPAVALSLLGLGAALALVQGARASDRSGRGRAVAIGLALVSLAVGAALLGLLPLGGFLAGIGVVMVAMAAPAWVADLHAGTPAVAALTFVAAALGLAASVLAPLAALGVAAVAALLVAVAAPETVPGPQTPTWMLPARPDLRGRGVSVALLALVAIVAPLAWLPAVPGAIVAGAVALLVAAAAARSAAAARRTARLVAEADAPVARDEASAATGHANAVLAGGKDRPAFAGPGSRGYRRAVAAFDPTEPLRPARAVVATDAAVVAAAVREAAAAGQGVRVHSTGHAAASSSSMTDELLVRTRFGGAVSVDPARRLVRVPAGTPWADVVAAAAPYGLAVPHGSSGHVGVIGYLSRGGLSAYARSVGIAANSIESVELVTADGRVVVASREHEPELFWAVRGGGGGFGVITAVTVRAFDPGQVVTGTAMWELADADAVAGAWADWTVDAPANITTSLRVMSLPPLPGMPLRLSGRKLLVIDGTAIDRDGLRSTESAGDLLATLRRAGRPVFDSWRATDVREVAKTHMDPDFGGIAHRTDTAMLGGAEGRGRERSRAIVAAFLEQVTPAGSPFLMAELRQLGGALRTAPEDAGAVGSFEGDFAWFGGALIGKRRSADEVAVAFAGARAAFAEWITDYTVPTFAADRDRPQRNYPEEVRVRVEAIRAKVDPTGMFRGDVAVGALAG
ncbi:FAD-dependent oxidoreductase [Agromyces sp. MMS24-JH15]|uniref:FAD-binding oxidoreductase n=1 Tax=Agromyces sp. MMS24-JH15 TaxID=3243765 RepID=UPI0037489B0B